MDLLESKGWETTMRHPWELARIEIVKKLIQKNIPPEKITETIVYDIGCGDTFVLEKLVDFFTFNSGIGVDIEFNDNHLTTLNERFNNKNISIYRELDHIQDQKNEAFKIVLLLDVVEHIENDYDFMKMLSEHHLFQENTIFFITVPAFQKLFTSHDVFLKHYRRYSKQSMQELLQKNDFKIIKNGYFFISLLIPRGLSAIKEHFTKRKNISNTQLGSWNKGETITSMIKNILLLDYFITSKLSKIITLPGLSTFAVCKKRA